MKAVNIVLLIIATLLAGSSAALATEVVLFYDDFSGPLTWDVSDSSVYIKDGSFLYIGADGTQHDDWAVKLISISLSSSQPIVIEQRIKLESGGLNYRLPNEKVWFDDGIDIDITYLPSMDGNVYGWRFGVADGTGDNGFTGNDNNPVPGEGYWETATADYWAVTKMVLTDTGGNLYVKPDDAERGWFSTEFASVASRDWSHSSITQIDFRQPWDAVCYVDWIKVSQIPEPGTVAMIVSALAGFAGLAAARRMRK